MSENKNFLTDKKKKKKFWGFLKPYKKTIFLSLALIFCIASLGLIQPLLIKKAIDDYIAHKDVSSLLVVSSTLLLVIGVEYGLRCMQVFLMQKTGEETIRDIRNALYAHIQSLKTDFFSKQPIGRLVTRCTTDIEALTEMFTSGLVAILADLFMIIGIVFMLFYLSPQMTLASFLVLPFLVIAALYFQKKMRSAFRNIRKYVGNLNGYLQENLNGMDVVQTFNQEEQAFKEFNDLNFKIMGFHFQNITYDAILYSIVEALSAITMGLIIWFSSGSLIQGLITAGTLVAFIEYIQRFFIPIRDLSQKYAIMQSGLASLERIFALLETKELIPVSAQALIPHKVEGYIEFKNISFSYKENEPVLKNVSFKIQNGEKVAFVGPTGSGKSTIMKLITRLYDVNDGEILLDGIDVRNLNLKFLRKNVCLVSQDFFIFSGSVSENVSLGDPSITKENVIEACKAVGIHEFILSLTQGYGTKLAEKGSNISVGQRQLISFARAFAFNPKVLILDEATSNIDTHTEILIQKALEKLIEGRTSMIIAHRLSTIRNVDRIFVLHKGKIIENGSHEQLVREKGLYHKLYSLQFQPHL
ncbi:MAG: ABC transporter ATP-binding protein [Deltaproteobacteria bacterium]|nr:ABC transporter ATP-binding protein [Deltaproteobacteria bacterium]